MQNRKFYEDISLLDPGFLWVIFPGLVLALITYMVCRHIREERNAPASKIVIYSVCFFLILPMEALLLVSLFYIFAFVLIKLAALPALIILGVGLVYDYKFCKNCYRYLAAAEVPEIDNRIQKIIDKRKKPEEERNREK